jgi:hypothetical protein
MMRVVRSSAIGTKTHIRSSVYKLSYKKNFRLAILLPV